MSRIHIIAGPTASGKSALAMRLARSQNGVVINADSQQLYRELRIVTARPTEADETAAPHRLYGVLSGSDPASAAKWLKLVEMEINWGLSEGLTPIVVGGTGLYLKALIDGIAEIPDVPLEIRAQAESDLAVMGGAAFHERLSAVDPKLAARIHATDPQRMIRGWAVWLATGKPLTYWHKIGNKPIFDRELFDITKVEIERDELYRRCEKRVDIMLCEGAIEEIRALLAYNYAEDLPIMKIIGVPELRQHLSGYISLAEATDAMKQSTRNYAKRQLTWLRNQL